MVAKSDCLARGRLAFEAERTRGNQEEAGAFSGHVRNKNKRKAESFGPHTVFVNYAPRRLEVTVLERSTLLEVRLE